MDNVTRSMQDRLRQLREQNGVAFDAVLLAANPRKYYPLGEEAPAYTLDEIVEDLKAIRLQGQDVCTVVTRRYEAYRGEGARAPGQLQRVLIEAILEADPNVHPVALAHDIEAVLEPNAFMAGLTEQEFGDLYDKCIGVLGLDAGHSCEYVAWGRGNDGDRDVPSDRIAEGDLSEFAWSHVPAAVFHTISNKEPSPERGRWQSTYDQLLDHLAYKKALTALPKLSEPTALHRLNALRVEAAHAGCWKLSFFGALAQAGCALKALDDQDGPLGPNAAKALVSCLTEGGFSPETARLQAGSLMFLAKELRGRELKALITPVREDQEGCYRLCNWTDPADFAFLWADPTVTEESLREAGWYMAERWPKLLDQLRPRDAA